MKFSKDKQTLVVQTGNMFHFYDANTFTKLHQAQRQDIPASKKSLWEVLWGGKILSFINQSKELCFVDTETNQLIENFNLESTSEEPYAIAGQEA